MSYFNDMNFLHKIYQHIHTAVTDMLYVRRYWWFWCAVNICIIREIIIHSHAINSIINES